MTVVPSQIVTYYSGGVENSSPRRSLGGPISDYEWPGQSLHDLFDPVRGIEAVRGASEYRTIYVRNEANDIWYDVVVWLRQDEDSPVSYEVAVSPAGINGEAEQTYSQTEAPQAEFFSPTSYETGVYIGDLKPRESCALIIKRSVEQTDRKGPDAAELIIEGACRKETELTITDLFIDGLNDVMYKDVYFQSSQQAEKATVTIYNAQNITFKDCVFGPSEWNGVSINHDTGRTITNIVFEDCLFKGTARMGFECTGRAASTCYDYITLRRCRFEPQGSQAISFDGPNVDAHVTIEDVVIEGAGNNLTFPWGHGVEINGIRGVSIDGLTIYQVRGSALNLTGPAYTVDCGWTLNGVVADMSTTKPGQTQPMDALSQVMTAFDVRGSVWQNSFLTAKAPGGEVMYLSRCINNDFRGMTVRDASMRFEHDDKWEVNGCSGNQYNFRYVLAPAGKSMIRSASTSYSTARAGGTLTLNPYTYNYVGQDLGYECYETFLSFDTSFIPDAATVERVDIWLRMRDDGATTDFVIEARAHDFGSTLETSDWVAGADLSSKTLLATLHTSEMPTNDEFYYMVATPALLSAINTAGYTRMLLCSNRHRMGSTPTTVEDVGIDVYSPMQACIRVQYKE